MDPLEPVWSFGAGLPLRVSEGFIHSSIPSDFQDRCFRRQTEVSLVVWPSGLFEGEVRPFFGLADQGRGFSCLPGRNVLSNGLRGVQFRQWDVLSLGKQR